MNQITPSILLFAALRRSNVNGTKVLVLVGLKTGIQFDGEEETLKNLPIPVCLGDFLSFSINENPGSNAYSKIEAPNNWKVAVQKDVAYILNVKARLVNTKNGKKVFRNDHFCDALFQGDFREGMYTVRIRLLPKPHKLTPTKNLHFQATKPQIILTPRNLRQLNQLRLRRQSSLCSSVSSTYLPNVPERVTVQLERMLSMSSSHSSTYLPPVPKRKNDDKDESTPTFKVPMVAPEHNSLVKVDEKVGSYLSGLPAKKLKPNQTRKRTQRSRSVKQKGDADCKQSKRAASTSKPKIMSA